MRLSIIIPAYKEPLLQKTIDSLLDNAEGEIEVIPVVDGRWLSIPLKYDSRVKPIYFEENKGMRKAINAGLSVAIGEYIMKTDAHCLFAQGYDKILMGDCADNWLVIPRRYALDDINWKPRPDRAYRDYHILFFPSLGSYGLDLVPGNCMAYDKQMRPRNDIEMDDTMSFQGSCWVANRKYFMEHVGFLDDRKQTYGSFAGEQLEVGLKYWLGGGEVKVNKRTWYAHLSKRPSHYSSGDYSRKYKKNNQLIANRTWATKHWMNDEEPNMVYKFEWLISKFWPLPSWSDDWKEQWKKLNSVS